jgi:hypothetical protein
MYKTLDNLNIILCRFLYAYILLFVSLSVSAQIVQNGDFETGDLTDWSGFNNQVLTDDLTSSFVGNVNNAEGSLLQDIAVTEGVAYTLKFDYRWVSASEATNYDMNFRILDSDTSIIEEYTLSQEPDVWFTGVTIHFVVPADETTVRLVWYKINGSKPLRLDNVSVTTFDDNLITNPGFETGTASIAVPSPWGGFKNMVYNSDDIVTSKVGHLENGDGSLYQEFSVVPGETYDVNFEYRWIGSAGAANSDMTVRVQESGNPSNILELIGGDTADGLTLNTGLDEWFDGQFSFQVPTGINAVRLMFFKSNDNKSLNLDHVYVQKRLAPKNIIQTAYTADSSTFSWDSSTSEFDGYDWVITNTGDNPDILSQVIFSGQTATGLTLLLVDSLTEDIDYDIFLRTLYEDPDNMGQVLKSKWTAPYTFSTGFQGNIVKNSRFTVNGITPNSTNWEGFNQNEKADQLNAELIGFIDNDGTLRQDFSIVPGVEYLISFNYRWNDVGRIEGNSISSEIRIPDISGASGILQTLNLPDNSSNVWHTAYYNYTLPESENIHNIRLQFFKQPNRNQFHINNVSVVQNIDLSSEADFYFKNGIWSQSSPEIASTSTDDIIIFNGKVTLQDISANKITVKPWTDVDLEGVLTLNDSLIIEDGGQLTFKSNASSLGQLNSGNVTGSAIVERFIPAQTNNRRAYRYVTSSVNTATTIRDNWQEGGRNNIDGFGTQITGSSTGDDGFDATQSGVPSMYTYDVAIENWLKIPNTDNTNLEAGKGYILYVRGDRQHNLNSNPTDVPNSDVILRAKGSLLTGSLSTNGTDLPSISSVENKFSLVGNPYQAIIDFSQSNRLNLTDYIYVWDANLAGNNGVGGYVTIDLTDIVAPSPSGSSASKFIAPGQSFFVQNTPSGNGSITFEESNKATSEPEVEVFSSSTDFYINSRLYKTQDLMNGHTECDAIGLRFNQDYSTLADYEDAVKIMNSSENYSIVNNGLRSIDKQNLPVDNHVVYLNTQNYLTSDYSFTFSIGHQPDGVEVYLKDNYLGTQVELNTQSVYDFQIDGSMPESSTNDRFELIFKEVSLSTSQLNANDVFILYPNPASNGFFTISQNTNYGDSTLVELYSQTGQLVISKTFQFEENNNIKVDVSNLSNGFYIVEISSNGKKTVDKLIIN